MNAVFLVGLSMQMLEFCWDELCRGFEQRDVRYEKDAYLALSHSLDLSCDLLALCDVTAVPLRFLESLAT